MVDEVRYVPNGNNRVLKHVLRQAWELRCYWCREFKEYLALEIDHILPQDSADAERERLQKAFDVPDDYDVHAVYNLAPICGDCNKLKTNEDLTQKGVVLSYLKQARRLAPKVTRGVRSFGRATKLGEALLLAAEVDLSDDDTRATFEEGAPAIVQRLAELGDGKADYLVHREVTVEAQDTEHTFFISLNEGGRAAMGVFEQIAGGVLSDALAEPMDDLYRQIEDAVADALRSHDDGLGTPDVGSVSLEWPSLAIDGLSYAAIGPGQVEFEFEGAFEGLATGSMARSSADGSELEDVQGDASFSCRFKFDLAWEVNDASGEFVFDQVWIDSFDAVTLVDGKSEEPWWDWPDDNDEEDHLQEV